MHDAYLYRVQAFLKQLVRTNLVVNGSKHECYVGDGDAPAVGRNEVSQALQ